MAGVLELYRPLDALLGEETKLSGRAFFCLCTVQIACLEVETTVCYGFIDEYWWQYKLDMYISYRAPACLAETHLVAH